MYAELTASQSGTYIYQDISTTPGAVYKWSLKHASLNSTYTDKMSVMIGTTTSQKAQNATRINKNTIESVTGASSTSTVISTRVTNTDNRSHASQWCTYTGTYLIPSGQTTTRFCFKNIDSKNDTAGNLLDDIVFQVSYPLYYNLSGGTSTAIPAPTANNYAGYHTAGTNVALTTNQPTRNGYTFLGWSASSVPDIINQTMYDQNKSKLIKSITMASPSKTVYAVWAKNPTVAIHDPIGGTITSHTTIPYGNTYTLPATEPNRYGYTFREYNTSPDGTGQSITEDIPSVMQDTDLYIIWDAIPATASKSIMKDRDIDGNIIPNKYTLSMSTEGRTYTQDKHLIFVVDRTGSLTQLVYDELADTLVNLSKQLTQNENVKISCVLFSGTNTNPQSDYYSGYYIPFMDSTNIEDFKKLIGVPVSTTVTGIINGVDYSGEREGGGGTSWHSGFIGLEQILRDTQQSNTSPVDIMFFSDGYPNAHVNDNGQCVWGAAGNEAALAYEKATTQLKQVLASYSKRISSFSSIGLEAPGGDLTIMKTFTDECLNGYDNISKTSINAPTAASVSQNLRDIAEKNTIEGHLQNIRIEDMLSENVEPASTDDQGRPAVSIYKRQEDTGNKTELIEKEDYSYVYDATTKKLMLQYNHPLPQGESIHMDIPIIPTDIAYQKQIENAPQNIGEKDTGVDSEGMPGYKSNEGTGDIAYASTPHGYQANARLPIPVIQPETGTITFDRNTPSAEGEDITIIDGIGKNTEIPENSYTLYGHILKGWAETPDGEPVIQPGDEYTITDKNKTLYAIWETVWIEMPETGGNPTSKTVFLLLGTLMMLTSFTFIYNNKKRNNIGYNQYKHRDDINK